MSVGGGARSTSDTQVFVQFFFGGMGNDKEKCRSSSNNNNAITITDDSILVSRESCGDMPCVWAVWERNDTQQSANSTVLEGVHKM